MDTLSDKEKSVIFRIKSALDSKKASYFLYIRNEFVGFRKYRFERLWIYLSRHTDRNLFIHIRNPEKDSNEAFLFDENQIDSYISAGIRLLAGDFVEVDVQELIHDSETDGDPSLQELKEWYHFAVSWGKVLPIEIMEIVAKDSFCAFTIFSTEKTGSFANSPE